MDFICIAYTRSLFLLQPSKSSPASSSHVTRRGSRLPFRRDIRFGQPAIDDEVCGIHKAAFIASEEDGSMCLLHSLSEPACGEVNLATEPFLFIVAKKVLEHRCTAKQRTCQQ